MFKNSSGWQRSCCSVLWIHVLSTGVSCPWHTQPIGGVTPWWVLTRCQAKLIAGSRGRFTRSLLLEHCPNKSHYVLNVFSCLTYQFVYLMCLCYYKGSETLLRGKNVRSRCDGLDQSFMVDSLSYFLFQPVLHYWYNKGRGMCYPVCGMVHIKLPLLLIGNSSPYGGSGFPLSLSDWSFTNICLTPYNHK